MTRISPADVAVILGGSLLLYTTNVYVLLAVGLLILGGELHRTARDASNIPVAAIKGAIAYVEAMPDTRLNGDQIIAGLIVRELKKFLKELDHE